MTDPRNGNDVGGFWYLILHEKHINFDHLPIDEWSSHFPSHHRNLRKFIETSSFNKVFDLIQFILRHKNCPIQLVRELKHCFFESKLAYVIQESYPPTIIPVASPEEGVAVVSSLEELRNAGLFGSTSHLRKASEAINNGDWAGGIRESIHAVESVARQLDQSEASTLRQALSAIEKHGNIHPALRNAFLKLYGYTSDEQGIRHALLDSDEANVGLDEAVFMLGACASFASFLWRKHVNTN